MNSRPLDRFTIAVAQLNAVLGDVAGNAEKVRRAMEEKLAAESAARYSRE